MAWYQGPCRITVTAVAADFPQRAVVTLSGGAIVVIPGAVGESRLIEAAGFHLALEHRHGGVWRPNVRALQSKWSHGATGRSQVVRSKDVDWPGDRAERNLVLRIDRPDGGREAPGAPVGRREITESTAARGTEAAVPSSAALRTEAAVPSSAALRTDSEHGADFGVGVPAPRVTTSGHSTPAPRARTPGQADMSFG